MLKSDIGRTYKCNSLFFIRALTTKTNSVIWLPSLSVVMHVPEWFIFSEMSGILILVLCTLSSLSWYWTLRISSSVFKLPPALNCAALYTNVSLEQLSFFKAIKKLLFMRSGIICIYWDAWDTNLCFAYIVVKATKHMGFIYAFFFFPFCFFLFLIFKKEARTFVFPFFRYYLQKQNLLINDLSHVCCELLNLLWRLCQTLQRVWEEGISIEERLGAGGGGLQIVWGLYGY